MKVSRLSKSKSASRRHSVVRLFPESDRDYRWWRFQDTEPECGYILVEYVRSEPAYPRVVQPSTRIAKLEKLSRRALKNRLYQQKVPRTKWAELLSSFANRSLFRTAGDPSIRQTWGHAISKAVTRHVRVNFLVLDEFWNYANAKPLLECARSARSFNITLALQAAPAHPESVGERSGGLTASPGGALGILESATQPEEIATPAEV